MAGREFLNAESLYFIPVGRLSSRDPIPVYRRKDTSLLVWNTEQTPVILNQPERRLTPHL
jgi:hypothetical protein